MFFFQATIVALSYLIPKQSNRRRKYLSFLFYRINYWFGQKVPLGHYKCLLRKMNTLHRKQVDISHLVLVCLSVTFLDGSSFLLDSGCLT